jgi:hypothetical protein
VEFTIDSMVYETAVGANGIALVSLSGFGTGLHEVDLTEPPGCYDPVTVTCATGSASTSQEWESFDRLWGEESTGEQNTPQDIVLFDNYPNPFNPSTTIRYALPEKAHVKLEVFNILGQSVAVLVEGEREAGYHSAVFDGVSLASGMWQDFVQTKRLLLLR